MKKTILMLIIAPTMLFCCKESTPNKAPDATIEYVNKTCRIAKTKSYSETGTFVGETVYYYTAERLDSFATINQTTQARSSWRYEYSDKFNRTQKAYNGGVKSPGYIKQTLDEFGNIVVTQSFGDDNKPGYKYTTDWNCN